MDTLVGQTIEQYQILFKLGDSGSGAVYRALDVELDQKVIFRVLKQINRDAESIEHLQTKIDQIQAINHPNIAKILKVGKTEDFIYIVNEYIPKNSLRQRMTKRISWKKAAAVLAPVARALEYAHKNNVFHGDLKPTNILFSEEGSPILTDIGLRLILEESVKEQLVGTWLGFPDPRYIAPEQIFTASANASSDIYSLGVIFLEMIMGKNILISDQPISQLLEKAFAPSQKFANLKKKVPDRVITMLSRSMAAEPQDRYKTIGEFAKQLELIAFKRTLSSTTFESIKIDKKKQVTRRLRWIGLGFAALLVGVGVYWQLNGGIFHAPSNPVESGIVASPTPTLSKGSTLEPEATIPFASKPTSTPSPTLTVNDQSNIKYPLLMNTPLPADSNTISLENSQRLIPIARWGMGKLTNLIWSPDGKYQAMSASTGVYIIASDLTQSTHYINAGSEVTSIDYSSDGKLLALATSDGLVQIWNTETWTESYTFGGYSLGVRSVKFSHDGKLIAATSESLNIKVWELSTQSERYELKGHTRTINGLMFSPDDRFLASGSDDLTIRIWSLETGAMQQNMRAKGQVMDMDFSSNGSELVTGGGGNVVQIWDWLAGNLDEELTGYNEILSSVSYSPDGASIVTSDASGNIWCWKKTPAGSWMFLWKTKSSGLGKIIDIEGYEYVNSSDFSPDGALISSGEWDGTIDHLDPESGKILSSYYGLSSFVNDMVISRDGKHLAVQTLQKTVKLWDIDKSTLLFTFPGTLLQGDPFSHDLSMFAMNTDSQTLTLWDLKTGEIKYSLSGHTNIRGAVFSSDGVYLAVLQDKYLKIWSLGSKQELIIENKMEYQCTAAYLINKTPLAFASALGFPGFWDNSKDLCEISKPAWVTSWDVLESSTLYALGGTSVIQIGNYSAKSSFEQKIQGITGLIVSDVSFSPDGTLLAGGLNDAYVKVWEVESAKEIISLAGHKYPITSLAFSPDGKYLVSSSLDGLIIVWGIK